MFQRKRIYSSTKSGGDVYVLENAEESGQEQRFRLLAREGILNGREAAIVDVAFILGRLYRKVKETS